MVGGVGRCTGGRPHGDRNYWATDVVKLPVGDKARK